MILLIILFFILFLIWTILLKKGYLKSLDDKVYHSLKIKEPFITILKIITLGANTKFLILFCILFYLLYYDKKIAIIFSINMFISSILNFTIKHIIKRERPNIRRLVTERGYSYPSGHTTSSVCCYGLLSFLIIISTFSLSAKIVLCFLFISLILSIAFSRIYLGVHYFSDIIGAMLISSSYLLLYLYIVYFTLNLI